MRVVEIRETFGLDSLVVGSRERPEPAAGQVLLGMRAASLNYRDLLMVRGHYNPRQPLPLIPCSDGVGQVLATGRGVTRVRRGDRVIPIFAQEWISGPPETSTQRSTLGGPLDGTLAEAMLVDQEGVVKAPGHLSDEQAATLPCAALTAWNALVTHGELSAGGTVLIQGTGGVSIFALQFAGLLGARAIVTSSSDEKLERATALGAWRTLNYREHDDWGKQVKRLTDGAGVDLVVEVGGAGTLAQSVVACKAGGRIALIGILAGGAGKLDLTPLLMRQIRVQGVFVGCRTDLEAMNAAIDEHGLEPVVDRTFALDEIRPALEHLASGKHFGKIAIRIAAAKGSTT